MSALSFDKNRVTIDENEVQPDFALEVWVSILSNISCDKHYY